MKIKWFTNLFLLLLIPICFSISVHAKEYAIPELRIEVLVHEDGRITITEHRTYIFDGSYSWANYRLPKSGYSAIRDIHISEEGSSFTNLNSEEPETFLVEESDQAFNIKWFFDAEDERRTFTVKYTLQKAVVIGPEWSEFFWTYAASGREKSTETFNISVRLPGEVSASQLHAWVREPAWKIKSSFLTNGFQFDGENISRSQAVTIRTLFPTAVFNEEAIQVTDPDFNLTQAEQEEQDFIEAQREAAEKEQQREALAIEISIIIAGISIIAFIFFYRRYGSRHTINLSVNESIMIPGREKPAAIGWLLMNRTVTHNLIMATLLDLARQDYFTIKENEPEDEGWMSSKDSYFTVHPTDKEPGSDVVAFEQNLIEFMKARIEHESNKLDDIFNYNQSAMTKWFYQWKKELKHYCKSKEWIDLGSYTGAYWNAGVQSILLLASTVLLFLLHPLLFIGMGVSFIGLVLSMVIIRRTPKGEELYRRWKSYRSALKNAEEHSISEELLGVHFIYSIAFGLGKKPVETIFEQHPGALAAIYWIAILPGSGSSPANIASSFSTLAATGTATAGGGSIGGGASAGSAGGGASGGAG
ncbi:MAG: DUF2207 domain-containing protein [Gracilimonas sp.]|nr:DUF2207 domain-containing protein [Gracilimonas sp.]